jgi:hypothetical protein
MKKLLLLLLFSLIGKTSIAVSPAVEVIYKEHFAVFWFLSYVSPNAIENKLKTTFEGSEYNTAENRLKLEQYESLSIFSINVGDNLTIEEIDLLNARINARYNIVLKLLWTENMTEFKENPTRIIPDQEMNVFINTIDAFTPIYRALIYEPYEKNIKEQLINVENWIVDNKIPEYLEKINTFLQTGKIAGNVIKLVIYPMLDPSSYSFEFSYNHLACPLSVSKEDLTESMNIILTYLFQFVNREHMNGYQDEIYPYFEQNQSAHSIYAYSLFYETLILIFANAYQHEQPMADLFQIPELGSTFTNQIGKVIFPKVLEYLNQNKVMDKAFVDEYIATYETSFSNWTSDFDFIMSRSSSLVQDDSYLTLMDDMYHNAHSDHYNLDYDFSYSLDFLEFKDYTKVIVIDRRHEFCLAEIQNKFPELADWKYDSTQEFIKIQFLNDRTNLVIINQHNTPLKELLEGYSNK